MGHNQKSYKFYVVNVQTIAIDSGWDYREDAMTRAKDLKEETGVPAKVMTKPRIGFGPGETVLDPKDDASWSPKRRANPGRRKNTTCTCDPRFVSSDCEVHGGLPRVGALYVKRDPDRHNRVFRVEGCDGKIVRLKDVVNGDTRTVSVSLFEERYTDAPKRNPEGSYVGKEGEPEEGDITTKDYSRFYQDGKKVLTVDPNASDADMWRALDKHMAKNKRFPNVWCISEHGACIIGVRDPQRRNPGGKAYSRSTQPKQGSGYTDCGCRDCFDVTVSADMRRPELCSDCEEAGCEVGEGECRRDDAYGVDDELKENPNTWRVEIKRSGVWEKYPDLWKTREAAEHRATQVAKHHNTQTRVVEDNQHQSGDAGYRKNPGELLVVNPGHDSKKAEKVYELWHKKAPNGATVKRPRMDNSDEMVCVGKAFDIVYRSKKWEKGNKTNDYVHTFDSKPKVWMSAKHAFGARENPSKTIGDLLRSSHNADGQFACADLATPISFSLGDGNEEIVIHSGARVYGGTDQKTVVIHDPVYGLIVIKGGQMHFDERGIVK